LQLSEINVTTALCLMLDSSLVSVFSKLILVLWLFLNAQGEIFAFNFVAEDNLILLQMTLVVRSVLSRSGPWLLKLEF